MVGFVLLVEGDSSTSVIHTGALNALGYQVRSAAEAGEALRQARSLSPDLILLGHSVAGGTPAGICRSLKLDPVTNTIPLVRLGEAETDRLEIEADAYLARPRDLCEMAATIERAQASRDEVLRQGASSDARWRLPSDPDTLEEFRDEFRDWLQGTALTAFQMQQTGLAVRELAANAIEWGHAYERSRVVSVSARADEEKVSVLVRDTGPGFNPRDLPHAARRGDPVTHLSVRAARQLREGGYGILMASGLVDHLAYNDIGNEALAIKFLPRRSMAAGRRDVLASA